MPDETPTWFTTVTGAKYANRAAKTVIKALREQRLQGYQESPGAAWSIHRDDLDHWLMGGTPETAPTRRTRPLRKAV